MRCSWDSFEFETLQAVRGYIKNRAFVKPQSQAHFAGQFETAVAVLAHLGIPGTQLKMPWATRDAGCNFACLTFRDSAGRNPPSRASPAVGVTAVAGSGDLDKAIASLIEEDPVVAAAQAAT
jgi:hypothetical protein